MHDPLDRSDRRSVYRYEAKIPFSIWVEGKVWRTVQSEADNLDDFHDEMCYEHPEYKELNEELSEIRKEFEEILKRRLPRSKFTTDATIRYVQKVRTCSPGKYEIEEE